MKDFIDNLPLYAQAKLRNTVRLLEEFGIRLGLPHAKKLAGTQLWELRVLGSTNIRIFYIAVKDKTFILLHGFLKKKQKTPISEIRLAEQRLAQFLVTY